MNPDQLDYFRHKLLSLRRDILREAQMMLANLQQETQMWDAAESALRETIWITECSLLNQEQSLLNAIDAALERIEEGNYGYCEETGDPISFERLEAYPMATLSREAQQEQERRRRLAHTAYRPVSRSH